MTRKGRFGGSSGLANPIVLRDGQLLLVLTAALPTLAAINAVSWLLAAVLVALVAVAGLTTIPARLATRHPPGEILRSETR